MADQNSCPITAAQFWGLIIQCAGVVVSLFLAVLAIWGEQIRAKLVGPKLKISLHDPEGILTTFTNGTKTRYYHLKIANKRKGSMAQNVRVVISTILRPAADGRWVTQTISGPLQLTWQFPQIHPQYSAIGPDDICDLGFLTENKGFQFPLYIIPNNFKEIVGQNQRVRIQIMALADNAKSEIFTVEISWDGTWSEDTLEMKKHLVVNEV